MLRSIIKLYCMLTQMPSIVTAHWLHAVDFGDIKGQSRHVKCCNVFVQDPNCRYFEAINNLPDAKYYIYIICIKRAIALILVNIAPRWDINGHEQVRVL